MPFVCFVRFCKSFCLCVLVVQISLYRSALLVRNKPGASSAWPRFERGFRDSPERFNAGGSLPIKAGLGTPEEWEEGMRLNFDAGRNLAHTLVDSMQAQKFGRIINLTGTQEPLGFNAAIPPNGAVTIWSKLLASVVAKDGVTVNCISPGIVHSEQIDDRVFPSLQEQEDYAGKEIPVGYIGEAEDVALMAVFLCSPRARYTTGEVIYVDAGAKRYPH